MTRLTSSNLWVRSPVAVGGVTIAGVTPSLACEGREGTPLSRPSLCLGGDHGV
jgi:hypothetical protein